MVGRSVFLGGGGRGVGVALFLSFGEKKGILTHVSAGVFSYETPPSP